MTQFSRKWRTLVRITKIDTELKAVHFVIPGLSYTQVSLPIDKVPKDVFEQMAEGKRLHVQCNIGAESLMDLDFSEWETE